MAILRTSKRVDHLNLSVADRESAIKKLVEIIGSDADKLSKLAQKRIAGTFSHGAIFSGSMSRFDLTRGIISALQKELISDIPKVTFFFAHFFCEIWEVASADERKALKEKLYDGLNTNTGLTPFFIEMGIAFSYLRKQHDAHLIDLVRKEARSHDYDIESGGFKLALEVKTLAYESGLPSDAEAINNGLSIISKWAAENLPKQGYYLLDVTLLVTNRLTYQEIADSARQITILMGPSPGLVENEVWRILIKDAAKEDVRIPLEKLIKQEFASGDYAFILPPLIKEGNYLIGVRLLKDWSHKAAINAAIKAALKQLPKSGLRLIHLHLTGAPIAHNHEFIMLYVRSALVDWSYLSDQFKKDGMDDFIGVSVSNDPSFVFRDDDPEVLAIVEQWALIANPDLKAANIYSFWFRKEMPSQSGISLY